MDNYDNKGNIHFLTPDKFDGRTETRLKREQRQTKIGWLTLKMHDRICRREMLKFRAREAYRRYEEQTTKLIDDSNLRIKETLSSFALKTEDCDFHLVLPDNDRLPSQGGDCPKYHPLKKHYPLTELSKIRRNYQLKKEKTWKKYIQNHNETKWIASLTSIKMGLLNNKWNYFCHLSERRLERDKKRQNSVIRAKWKYHIQIENFSADSPVFKKILEYEREQKRCMVARKRRMIEIIEKIDREECRRDIRLYTRGKKRRGVNFERSNDNNVNIISEVNSKATHDSDTNFQNLLKLLEGVSKESLDEEIIHKEVIKEDEVVKERRDVQEKKYSDNWKKEVGDDEKNDKYATEKKNVNEPKNEEEEKLSQPFLKKNTLPMIMREDNNEKIDFMKVIEKARDIKNYLRNMQSDKKVLKDTCFYGNPDVVTFKNFKIGKTYTRKVSIYNKTIKWAYLRYQGIESDILDSTVLQVEHMSVSKVRPGLNVTINIKFSPLVNMDVTADIIFFTLSPENICENAFHEFRIHVRCFSEMPEPMVEPTELRFPTMPIWKYNVTGFIQKTLTISNRGTKAFSFAFTKKESSLSSFSWDFENDELLSLKSTKSDAENHKLKEGNFSDSDFHESRPKTDTFKKQSTVETFTLANEYNVQVSPMSYFQLKVNFYPRYVGLHHEVFEFAFKMDGKIFKRQVVPFWGETTDLKIHLDPKHVDLGLVMIDSEVYQQNFNVINTGNYCVKIAVKTPKRLGSQIEVFPKTTFIQPESIGIFSVRLVPEFDIEEKSKGYFDQTSNLLSVPIQVQPLSPEIEGAPPLILKVLATVTTPYCLVINPNFLDLGTVHTQEAVQAEITLTNTSLVVQDYGFLNVPSFIEIQPNHGFGTILPGETVPLHLIYSAWLTDIPENEMEANGLTGDRKFMVQVVTLAEIVGNKDQLNVDKIKLPSQRLLDLPPKAYRTLNPCGYSGITDIPRRSSEVNKNFVKIASKVIIDKGKDSLVDVEGSTFEKHEIYDDNDNVREHKNIMKIFVHIVDPICELSEQIIEFPATPCGFFSMASVYLRGFNMASYPHCTCGLVNNQTKDFKAWYEFKSSLSEVKVCPQKGTLSSCDLVKVTFIFMPKLPNQIVLQKAQELKVERMANELKKQTFEKNQSKQGKKKEQLEPEVEVENLEISNCEKLPAEICLLETIEPYVLTALVSCMIEIKMKNGTNRKETLQMRLACPVVKPEIIILNSTREFQFGPTANGTTSKKALLVKNISNKKIKVDISLLNPVGSFFMPPGKICSPGSILTLPITYAPKGKDQKHEREFFEVRGAGTRTFWRLTISGSSVNPSWIITPEMAVARLEAKPGKLADFKMTVQNTCECPLIFKLHVIEILKGPIKPLSQNTPSILNTKGAKEKEKNVPKRAKISLYLDDDEETAIYDNKMNVLKHQDIFSYVGFDDKLQLKVPPNEKVDFTIHFSSPKTQATSEEKEDSKKEEESPKIKKNNDVSNNIDSTYYVARYKLILGNLIYVQNITLICSVVP